MAEHAATNLERLYRDRFSAEEAAAKERVWKVLCDDFFSRFVKPTDIVLDLACGYGEFINFIRCRERLAMDLNPDAVRYLSPAVRFFNRSCEDIDCIPDDAVDGGRWTWSSSRTCSSICRASRS